MGLDLSVVIPTRGRLRLLQTCLESLCAQTEAGDRFEVIVVLDGADDTTERALAALTTPFRLRVIAQDHAGPGAARNRGAEHSSARFLLFLDDDVVAEATLVASHLAVQRPAGGVVGIGRIEKTVPRRAARWAHSRGLVWRDHYERLEAGRQPIFTDVYGGNLSVERRAFAAVGGFAVDLPVEHDVELGYRLATAGQRLVFVADAVVREEDRDTLRHFLADAHRRGTAAVALYRRHPAVLPHLRIGGASEPGWRQLALRRLLLALRVSPVLLAVVGRLIRNEPATRKWFGFLFGYCYWRGVRGSVDRDTWKRFQRGAAILMYHAVGGNGEAPSRFVIPARRFRRQMAWLRLRRYEVIGLEQLVACRREHRLPPARSVVLTFDDGYVDNAELAVPVLERHGLPATLFLVTRTDGKVSWTDAPELRERRLLTPAEAGRVGGALAIGAHTRTHPRLTELGATEAEDEIGGSRADLEAAIGTPVTVFAYPFGDTSPAVEEAVARAGFEAACGVASGRNRPARDAYALRRMEIQGTDSLLRFALTLWLGDTRALFPRRTRRGSLNDV